jgi:hypothetical protein
MVEVEEPTDDLVKGTMISDIELSRVLAFWFRFYVTSDAGARATANL